MREINELEEDPPSEPEYIEDPDEDQEDKVGMQGDLFWESREESLSR
jgi:hypothetical protein